MKTSDAFMFFRQSRHGVRQLKVSDLFIWSQRFFVCFFLNHWQVRSFSPFRTWFCLMWMKTLYSYILVKFNFAVIGPLGLDADICPMRFPLSRLCTLSRVIQISKSKSSMINMMMSWPSLALFWPRAYWTQVNVFKSSRFIYLFKLNLMKYLFWLYDKVEIESETNYFWKKFGICSS